MSFWHIYMGIYGGGEAVAAVYYAIMTAVQSALRDLSLTDIDSSNIRIAKVHSERETVFPDLPGILIMPLGAESIVATSGTNASDDIGYPVAVIVFDQDRQQSDTGLPAEAVEGTQDQEFRYEQKLIWREKIRKQFINQRLTLTGPSVNVNRCTVEPGEVVRSDDWLENNIWVSSMVFRFWTRETRGN